MASKPSPPAASVEELRQALIDDESCVAEWNTWLPKLDALILAAESRGRQQAIDPNALRAQVQIALARLTAIRKAARKPARDFNLDYQLGMLHDNIETAFNIPALPEGPTP